MTRREPPPLIREALTALRSALTERFGERLAGLRLFGSHARGEGTEDSDVDVFVRLTEPSLQDRRAVHELAAAVSVDSGLLLSPLVFSDEQYAEWKHGDRAIIRDIENEGIAL